MKKYIDADIVNLKLKQICDNRNTSYGIQFGGRAKDFAQLTDDIPAADVVEVVHANWERSDKKYSYYQYKCSNCGCDDYTQTDRHGICKLMNYCPNCGAKMRSI